jgi:hypothetical protein
MSNDVAHPQAMGGSGAKLVLAERLEYACIVTREEQHRVVSTSVLCAARLHFDFNLILI